jgi:Fuc2NAc and GlcNAc transferase
MSLALLVVLCGGFCLSLAASIAMRRYALSRAMLDVPNARSSHVVPIPRGGGVAFVFSFLLGLLAFNVLEPRESLLSAAMATGGGIVALVGFRDDRASLSVRVRLFWQMLASGIALLVLGGWPNVELGVLSLHWGMLGYVFGVIVLIWAINLYNFMDGIDGLAISEAVFLSLGGGLLIAMAGGASPEALLLAAVCLGFAVLNWPPAKLFMGDAGSGFLGFVLAVIALDSTSVLGTTVWPWLILTGVFVVDASYTLICRILSGQRWHEAHRSHAYQRAAMRFGSHRRVTLVVQCINVFWLLPLAYAAQCRPVWGWALTTIAWMPLLCAARYMKAGRPDMQVMHASSPDRRDPQSASPSRASGQG